MKKMKTEKMKLKKALIKNIDNTYIHPEELNKKAF